MVVTTSDRKVLGTSYRVFDISSESENDVLSLKSDFETHLIWERHKCFPADNALRHYVKTYYEKVLRELTPETIYDKLAGVVLFSDEPNRNILAAWLELLLGKDAETYEASIQNGELVIQFELDEKKDELKNRIKTILASIMGIEQKEEQKEGISVARQDKLVLDGFELLKEQTLRKKEKTVKK